jgi:hypothetical protein
MQHASSRVFLSTISGILLLALGAAHAQSAPAPDPGNPDTSASHAAPNAKGNVSSKTPDFVEDWSTPSLKGSDLKLGMVLPLETFKGNGYTRELVRVMWRPTDDIDLYILRPEAVKNPPVILYLYSYPFELDRFREDAFCKFLTKNGVAAVAFASALTGQRYHAPRPMKQWFVSNLQESLSTTAHDVQMILNYLDSRHDFDMNRLGMFGDGSGAAIAILAASADPRIKTLDLLDPWGDWPDWIAKSTLIPENERPDYLAPEWLAKVASLDPLKYLPELKTQKIRIREIATVTVTPTEVRHKLEAAAPPNAEIVRFEDSNAFKASTLGGTGFDWIKAQVAGPAPLATDLKSPGAPARSQETGSQER